MKQVLILIFFVTVSQVSTAFCFEKTLYLNIYGPGQSKLNIYIASPIFIGNNENYRDEEKHIVTKLYDILLKNISYLPFLQSISQEEIVGGAKLSGVTLKEIDFNKFTINKIDLLTTIGWELLENGKIKIELRTFDIFSTKLYLGRGYILNNEDQVYIAANKYCKELMKRLTGRSGFFSSMIAFVKRTKNGSKNIFISTPQGYLQKQVTDLNGIALSPVWSWDGKSLVFTYLSNNRHELVLWNTNGKLKRIMIPGNTIISPTFDPSGNIVLSTDMSGNPDIYILDRNFKIKGALVRSWAIDISPSFDKSGEKMVYVSSRYGNPNIFLYDFKTKQTKRISYLGKYNTNPCISGDGKFVVYSTLTEKGHRIVLCDLTNMEEHILTHGPGNDEHPVWGPDDFFIAFCSNRTGKYKIYLTTKAATPPRVIDTGKEDTTAVAWSKEF